MHDNKSIIRSFQGDDETAEKELQGIEAVWKAGGQIGNLPLGTLLGLAWKYHENAEAEEPVKKKGRPAGAKNKPKPELANV